jgi:peptidyl-prolyl cis-trans isomerase B (cyclophilin B)
LTGTLYPGGQPVFGPEAFLILETEAGRMKIRLFPDKAPLTCGHVAALARAGFYNGLTWHRVVPDFVIQGGCPRGDGSGNAGITLPLESTDVPFERGTLGMPRDSHPDTGGCQLFICHSRVPHLDVTYCAFGQVVEGLDVIDRIDVDSHIVSARVEGLR